MKLTIEVTFQFDDATERNTWTVDYADRADMLKRIEFERSAARVFGESVKFWVSQ